MVAKQTDDRTTSELVSKSLSGDLSRAERERLESIVVDSSEGKAFTRLSELIHQSVTEVTHAEELSAVEEGLSAVAKERLRRSVRQAKRQQAARNEIGRDSTRDSVKRVAESETVYLSANESPEREAPESRQASSRFQLQEKIGEGGLGTVWLARDELLRRNVALKEMLPSAARSPRQYERFRREAEITAHLEHPNVVPLYFSGTNPATNLPFYVMRFVGKRTLAEAIREYHALRNSGHESPIDLHRLLNAFLDVCQAIAFAHSRGVIHRDLKPDNVALDSFGQVLVLDWGLAKLEGDGELAVRLALSGNSDEVPLSHTLLGDVVGTPLYMAPEQAAGKLDEIDARTDVYGLGAILFALLTGNAPHENSNRSDGGSLQVQQFLDSIVDSDTPQPRDINPAVPRDLEAICVRAMAKEKFARHASATELAAEVEGWIAGKREKESQYDAIRMAARDLKSRICVQIRQLAASAQFMVELPPIQGLLASADQEAEDFATWRERLSTILLALAKSKPSISALSFSQLHEDRVREFVRIERSLTDVSNVRALPLSRLRNGAANTFHKTVIQQFPGESEIDFDNSTSGSVRIVSGVPVFDAKTEEPFGLVCAEAEIGTLIALEMGVLNSRERVMLVNEQGQILYANNSGRSLLGRSASELISSWPRIADALLENNEYIDPDRDFYANRLSFPSNRNSIYFVFQAE